ncbi:MAG: hypothetical protein ABI692_08575 [Terracoccus sp.]
MPIDDVRRLQRADARAWTASALLMLDAARHRLGDSGASRRRRRHEVAVAARQAEMAKVVDHLIAADDSEMHVMSMLRGQDLGGVLADEGAEAGRDPDLLAGPFAHVVVDEAQELTDAEWQMLLLRCRRAASPASETGPRPDRGSPSRGGSGSSA